MNTTALFVQQCLETMQSIGCYRIRFISLLALLSACLHCFQKGDARDFLHVFEEAHRRDLKVAVHLAEVGFSHSVVNAISYNMRFNDTKEM